MASEDLALGKSDSQDKGQARGVKAKHVSLPRMNLCLCHPQTHCPHTCPCMVPEQGLGNGYGRLCSPQVTGKLPRGPHSGTEAEW